MQTFIDPDESELSRFMEMDRHSPIACLNLLRYRERADYGPRDPESGTDAADVSGETAYGRYGEVAMRHIERVGGRPLFAASALQMLIGPQEKDWDRVVIVFYPSRGAFLDMLADDDYRAAGRHRRAGLADTRLIVLDGAEFAR